MAIIKFNSVDGFSVGTSETTVIDGSGNISAVGATFTGSVSIGGVGITSVVTSVNGVTGPVTIAQGSNVTVSTVGSTITISSSAGGGGSSPLATTTGVTGVASFNPNHFSVSVTGTVSITGSYQTSLSRPFLFSGM